MQISSVTLEEIIHEPWFLDLSIYKQSFKINIINQGSGA